MFILQATAALNCSSYVCQTNQNFLTQQCIYAGKGTYYLKTCKSSIVPYCPPIFSNSTCLPTPAKITTGVVWPGEHCKIDSDCKYGVCYQSVCNSKVFGMPCLVNDECNPGLFCSSNSNTCAFQLEAKEKGCTSDYDCVNGAGCNSGICVLYYSLKPTATVDTCINNFNNLCINALCFSIGSFSQCASSVTSYQGTCNVDSDCVSSNDPVVHANFTSTCKCALSNPGASYCTQLPGDNEFSLYIKSMKNWVQLAQIRMCNTVRRFSSQCITNYYSQANILLEYMNYVQSYPMIKNNAACTKKIYYQNYWRLVNENSLQNE